MSFSVGLATGLYAVSFGALSTLAGLNIWQTMSLSLLMFSGASQFAFVGVIGSAGLSGLTSAVLSAWLLGVRNGFYGLSMSPMISPRGFKRITAAQLTIDESVAVSMAQDSEPNRKRGFWLTGMFVYLFWNSLTALGALAGEAMGDPKSWGLDAAAAAAFVGLIWPRLKDLISTSVALGAAVIAVVTSLFLPAGWPVLLAGLFGVLVALFLKERD